MYLLLAFQKPPPLSLLRYITTWVSSDPCLCSESVRLSRIQANFSCPFMGLVQWCILGHLYTHCKVTNEAEKTEILGLLSKLHFGILQSLLAYKSMELNQALFYMPHFVSLSQALMQLNSQGCKSEDTLHLLIEKIGQVIQVAMVTGSLKEEKGKNLNSFISSCFAWSINLCFLKSFSHCKKYIAEMKSKIAWIFSIRMFVFLKSPNDLHHLKNVKDLTHSCNTDFYANGCLMIL